MPIRITIAQSPPQLDSLFKLRHQVLAKDLGLLPVRPLNRVVDHFDAFTDTVNLMAFEERGTVGSLRLADISQIEKPADELVDYTDLVQKLPGKLAGAGMRCLVSDLRQVHDVCRLMLSLGVDYLKTRNFTGVVAPYDPDCHAWMTEVGFKSVYPDNQESPLLLDLNEFSTPAYGPAQELGILDNLADYDREFVPAGEKIVSRGQAGECAYVVASGKVVVSNNASGEAAIRLGPGNVFGELALLSNKPRSADVVALTNVDLLVLSRDVFQRHLAQNPQLNARMLEFLGARMLDPLMYVK